MKDKEAREAIEELRAKIAGWLITPLEKIEIRSNIAELSPRVDRLERQIIVDTVDIDGEYITPADLSTGIKSLSQRMDLLLDHLKLDYVPETTSPAKLVKRNAKK